MGILMVVVYTQLILIPILGLQLMAMRRERQRFKLYAVEVLNHTWRATPNLRR